MLDISVDFFLRGGPLAALIWVLVVLILGRPSKREGAVDRGSIAEADEREVALVVTLVHGTAGWFSSWLRERSRLRAHLESTFPGRIVFRRVPWSGLNSFKARRNGAACLRRHIRENASRWPAARQVVVAHSHGGSLSLEALNEDECLKNVDGLVCMATPFLTLTRYRMPLATPRFQIFFEFATFSVVTTLVVSTLLLLLPAPWIRDLQAILASIHGWFLPKDLTNPSIGDYFMVSLEIFVLPAIFIFSLTWLVRRWTSRCESVVVAALQDPRIDPDKLLILRQPGDEAAGAIAGLHAATLPLGLMIKLISSLLVPIEAARRRSRATGFGRFWVGHAGFAAASLVSAAAVVALFVVRAGTTIASGRQVAFVAIEWTVGALFVALSAFIFLLSAVGVVALLVALAHFISLVPAIFSVGPEMLFAGSRLKVTAEAAPIGAWRIVTIPMRAPLVRRQPLFGDLWHSYLYESEAAIEEIGTWLQKRLRP